MAEGSTRWSAARSCSESASTGSGTRDRPPPSTRTRVCGVEGGARPPKKSHSVLFRSKSDTFAFIDTQRGSYCVTSLCRRFGVTPAGYYVAAAWRKCPCGAGPRVIRSDSEVFRSARGTVRQPTDLPRAHGAGLDGEPASRRPSDARRRPAPRRCAGTAARRRSITSMHGIRIVSGRRMWIDRTRCGSAISRISRWGAAGGISRS